MARGGGQGKQVGGFVSEETSRGVWRMPRKTGPGKRRDLRSWVAKRRKTIPKAGLKQRAGGVYKRFLGVTEIGEMQNGDLGLTESRGGSG